MEGDVAILDSKNFQLLNHIKPIQQLTAVFVKVHDFC
jgi:hypothetical protein